MLFNSFEFALFLPIVFVLYWFVFQRNLKIQNALIVLASYTFYGWWDWRFLSLIFVSSVADFIIGQQLHKSEDEKRRKLFLTMSLVINLGFLGFFKYYNFFTDSFVDAFSMFGLQMNRSSLNIILPVGISFYTFQTLSYTIDIYRRQLEPTRDAVAFFAFVSFFPQLVAGPIERAVNLLPQFHVTRKFDYAKARDGVRQIFWGLFKKIVIADTCANNVNIIFENSEAMGGSALWLGALFFAFQIYGDFSGYSDIAIGTARLFGFGLMQNFATPYFSRDIGEFWRRWHISLSTWFRDYVYIPMGGSRVGKWRQFLEHPRDLYGKWFLAWSQLDLHHLGFPERLVLYADHDLQPQRQESSQSGSDGQISALHQGDFSDGHYLSDDPDRLGVFFGPRV